MSTKQPVSTIGVSSNWAWVSRALMGATAASKESPSAAVLHLQKRFNRLAVEQGSLFKPLDFG